MGNTKILKKLKNDKEKKKQWQRQMQPRTRKTSPLFQLLSLRPQRQSSQKTNGPQHGRNRSTKRHHRQLCLRRTSHSQVFYPSFLLHFLCYPFETRQRKKQKRSSQ